MLDRGSYNARQRVSKVLKLSTTLLYLRYGHSPQPGNLQRLAATYIYSLGSVFISSQVYLL